jgi:hypothetical protein
LQYRNGVAQTSASHEAALETLFHRSQEIPYEYNGQQRVYKYAAASLGADGTRYVPITVRSGGTVGMMREDQYVA